MASAETGTGDVDLMTSVLMAVLVAVAGAGVLAGTATLVTIGG